MPSPDNPTYGESRRSASLCWHCDRMVDALSAVEGTDKPEPGGISLCLYCGAVAIIGPDLVLLTPTAEQLDELVADQEFRTLYTRFGWARQYVMVKASLIRDRENPDR